jgi:ATP-dependent DNA helicase DinG
VILLPDAPALVAGSRHGVLLSADGELTQLEFEAAARRLEAGGTLVCHAPALARRINARRTAALDVLELFAFVCPARFCLPTVGGLARELGVAPPEDLAGEAMALFAVAEHLLRRLADFADPGRTEAAALAWSMGTAGWPWAPAVLAALGLPGGPAPAAAAAALQVWRRLAEW